MNNRSRFAIIVLHLIAVLTVALVIWFLKFASDLHVRELYGSSFVWAIAAFGLALTIGVEITAWKLREQRARAWAAAFFLFCLYAILLVLPLGMVSLLGFGQTIAIFCKSGVIDCRLMLVPMAKSCKSGVMDCTSGLFQLVELCTSGVLDCSLELADEKPPVAVGETFNINIGDHIAPDKPGQGAGRIDVPMTMDQYRFTSAPGTRLVVKNEPPCTIKSARWELRDPAGSVTHAQNLCDLSHQVGLVKGGTYIFSVISETETGDYAFVLEPMTLTKDQDFTLKVGDHVMPDKPGPGAGRIEVEGAIDRYTFTGEPGTLVYLKAELPCQKENTLAWEVFEVKDADARRDRVGHGLVCQNMGYFRVPHAGNYTITVFGFPSGTGDYGFALKTAPANNEAGFERLHQEHMRQAARNEYSVSSEEQDRAAMQIPVITGVQNFTLKVGDHVATDKPGAGAGRIEVSGTIDRYTFTANPGTFVYLEAEPPCKREKTKLVWEAYKVDDADTRLSRNRWGGGQVCRNTGFFQVPSAGTYTIVVAGSPGVTDDYGFALKTADNLEALERVQRDLREAARSN